ncbi:hypothetical protein SAMN05660748_3590 [Blastococcus aggregatus]|uniref:Polyketide cyclase / dehydrase and lipid transport n=1 Tax=Blastococcus aggregatus TaxID=38502 RepID=A0A285VEB4_9ACTN|nr:hypothetical protein SAMN05660748_3590 [Blastococcus aggregatus]
MRPMLAGACALLVLCGCTATGSPDPAASPTHGTSPADTGGASGTGDCTHPAGFRVSHPADWSVNPGTTLPACSWFAAESFDVPEATDVRIADITLKVVEGSRPPSAWPDVTATTAVEVGGRPGLRLERLTGPGLHPVDTPITTYVVDLPGNSDGDTLVASTVGLPRFDYERNVAVLESMMASLVLVAPSDA